MSGNANIPYVQEEPLSGVTVIEVSFEDCGLVIEADETLTDHIQLLSEPAGHQPELSRIDGAIRVLQTERYRGSAPPVLRVPPGELPQIFAQHARGDVKLERVNAEIAYNLASGSFQATQTSGALDARVARGQVQLRQHRGRLLVELARGNVVLEQCAGELAVQVARGDIRVNDCAESLRLSAASGDILLRYPNALRLRVNVQKGDVLVRSGSLSAADVKVAKGDIVTSTRFLLSRDTPSSAEQAVPPPPPPEPPLDLPLVTHDAEEGITLHLSGLEFEAGESGVRVHRGGRDVFRAGPEGVLYRRADGSEVSVGPQGIRVGKLSDEYDELEPGRFSFACTSGDVVVEVPNDVPARAELLITSGDLSSDIPLVEVGRPGPRGVVRRYVGATDSTEEERVLIRLKTDRGDIRLRSVPMAPAERDATVVHEAPTPRPPATARGRREESVRIILEALARGDLSPREAETLLDNIKDG